jgi:hypothetical protein
MANRIQIRRDSENNWNNIDPILADGELALTYDNNKIKVGDGNQNWSALSYIVPSLSTVATSGDYNDLSDKPTIYPAEPAFSVQTTNFNASVGTRYGVNTTLGAITATLPASPATGGAVFFADAGGAYVSNNLTIDPNGQTIMGASGNMTVSNNNQSFGLFFNGTTWRTYN